VHPFFILVSKEAPTFGRGFFLPCSLRHAQTCSSF
jgi:hypothetical protein